MKWGIIGTGNMGQVLLHALTSSRAVKESDIYLYNRTFIKAYQLKDSYPRVHVCQTMEAIIEECDFILLCAKPMEIIDISYRIKDKIKDDQTIISITSPISVEQLAGILHDNVARIIPSITNRANSGVSLMTFHENIDPNKKAILIQTFKHFSTPVEVEESHVRIASDIISCGPAFYSFMLEKMIIAANKQTGISEEKATVLAEHMMIGLGKLFDEQIFNLPTLKQKVMVKGGITGEGMIALEQSFQEVFENVFNATHAKFYAEQEKIIKHIEQKDNYTK